jgi:hypothetical protein
MTNYLISWDEVLSYSLEIEAPSKQEAIDKFLSDNYDREDVRDCGQQFDEHTVEIGEM